MLVALTVRQLTAGKVRIIAAARENENAPLLKQSGAHHVVVSSANTGRLLGLSTSAPPLIDVVEDLLNPSTGLALSLRSPTRDEIGKPPREIDDVVIALLRRGKTLPLTGEKRSLIDHGDMLIYVRDARSDPPPPAKSRG